MNPLKILRGFKQLDSPKAANLMNAVRGHEYYAKNSIGTFLCVDRFQVLQMTKQFDEGVRKTIESSSGEIFIDIGANIGVFSVLASRTFRYVIAIEPNVRVLSALKKNLLDNGATNVAVWDLAAWDTSKLIPFVDDSHSGVAHAGRIGSCVEAVKIDDALAGIRAKVSMVKIDVEGAESVVLRGMQEILKRDRPQVIFEASQDVTYSMTASVLEDAGYSIKTIDTTNYLAR